MKTAVEWLEMQIVKLEKDYAIPHKIYKLCEQAKEMEKQQIIDAYHYGYSSAIICQPKTYNPEKYYNQKYKKD